MHCFCFAGWMCHLRHSSSSRNQARSECRSLRRTRVNGCAGACASYTARSTPHAWRAARPGRSRPTAYTAPRVNLPDCVRRSSPRAWNWQCASLKIYAGQRPTLCTRRSGSPSCGRSCAFALPQGEARKYSPELRIDRIAPRTNAWLEGRRATTTSASGVPVAGQPPLPLETDRCGNSQAATSARRDAITGPPLAFVRASFTRMGSFPSAACFTAAQVM